MPDGKIVSAPYSVVACEKRMGLSGMSFFIGLNQMIEEYSSSFTPPFNNIIHKALRLCRDAWVIQLVPISKD
jgi:hypothetical protein